MEKVEEFYLPLDFSGLILKCETYLAKKNQSIRFLVMDLPTRTVMVHLAMNLRCGLQLQAAIEQVGKAK